MYFQKSIQRAVCAFAGETLMKSSLIADALRTPRSGETTGSEPVEETMNQPHIHISRPTVLDGQTVFFSASGFGWGYCSFALPVEVICEVLGAANTSAKQLILAFELGKRRILHAVENRAILGHDEPILLTASDLRPESN